MHAPCSPYGSALEVAVASAESGGNSLKKLDIFGRGATVGAIGVIALTVGGLGAATAANGGSLLLGRANSATATTTLTASNGTPLALVGKATRPPLTVDSTVEVRHLNAAMVDGQTAAQLQTQGSGASSNAGTSAPGVSLSSNQAAATRVASTRPLTRGRYFISATATTVNSTSDGAFCYLGSTADDDSALQSGGSSTKGYATPGVTVVVAVTKPERLGYYCYTRSTGSVSAAGITALKVVQAPR
jgi:hypothetical protein